MNNNRIVTSCCRRRNPSDWTYNNIPQDVFIDRGFTGHEHLDQFNLINMNGRIYDPLLAMFLSPDNYVQSPDLTLNFNRYSYALNNPLVFVDPSGNTKLPAAKINRDGGWGGFGPIASGMAFVNGSGFANQFGMWGAFIQANTQGYMGGYSNFVAEFLSKQSRSGGGSFTISWERKYTYYNSTEQIFTDEEGQSYRLPGEVEIGYERGSINVKGTVSNAESQGGYSVDNAVGYLNNKSYSSYSAANAAGDGAKCAMFIRWSLEAGFGLQKDALKGKAPVSARLYGPFLKGLGFTQVNTTNYLKGDIVVFQGYPGGTSDSNGVPYGHIQMYSGTQWLSNFYQNNFWPGSNYQKYQPALQIYRMNP